MVLGHRCYGFAVADAWYGHARRLPDAAYDTAKIIGLSAVYYQTWRWSYNGAVVSSEAVKRCAAFAGSLARTGCDGCDGVAVSLSLGKPQIHVRVSAAIRRSDGGGFVEIQFVVA